MKCATRTATLILAGFLAMTSTCGRAAGQGGGHGGSGGGHGFGGHAGHSAGRSSSGHSSGHSIGHSIGHSFAHILGHRGQGASSVALIKAPAKPWSVTPSPISAPQALRPQPRNPFIFRHRNGFFPRRRTSGFALRRQLELFQRSLLFRSILLQLAFRTPSLRLSIWQRNMV